MTTSYKTFNIWKLNRGYMQDVAHTGNALYLIGKEVVYIVKSTNSMYDPKNDIKAVNFYWVSVAILRYNTHLFCQSIKLWKWKHVQCPIRLPLHFPVVSYLYRLNLVGSRSV